MIAITGANGHLGRAILRHLLKTVQPSETLAIVRQPEKLDDFKNAGIGIRAADYENPDSLNDAFRGVEKLLQISTTGIRETGARHEQNVVNAAQEQGVKHIVYTSSLRPHRNALFVGTKQAFGTEEAILRAGIPYTFFRNSLYMETIPDLIGSALKTGQLFYPAGAQRISFVSREDIAEAISGVLTSSGHENRRYEITGGQSWSFEDIAHILQNENGSSVQYTDIPLETFEAELAGLHLPEDVSALLVSLARGIGAGEYAFSDNTLELLLGRKPLSLPAYLKIFENAF
jgi:NAD(P)H dehydrogenase (quinone)